MGRDWLRKPCFRCCLWRTNWLSGSGKPQPPQTWTCCRCRLNAVRTYAKTHGLLFGIEAGQIATKRQSLIETPVAGGRTCAGAILVADNSVCVAVSIRPTCNHRCETWASAWALSKCARTSEILHLSESDRGITGVPARLAGMRFSRLLRAIDFRADCDGSFIDACRRNWAFGLFGYGGTGASGEAEVMENGLRFLPHSKAIRIEYDAMLIMTLDGKNSVRLG